MSSISQFARNMMSGRFHVAVPTVNRLSAPQSPDRCTAAARVGNATRNIFNFVHFSLNQSSTITCTAEVIIQESTHKILLMAILHAA